MARPITDATLAAGSWRGGLPIEQRIGPRIADALAICWSMVALSAFASFSENAMFSRTFNVRIKCVVLEHHRDVTRAAAAR